MKREDWPNMSDWEFREMELETEVRKLKEVLEFAKGALDDAVYYFQPTPKCPNCDWEYPRGSELCFDPEAGRRVIKMIEEILEC